MSSLEFRIIKAKGLFCQKIMVIHILLEDFYKKNQAKLLKILLTF